ncbi:MAG: hypothetical protein JSS56_28135, partial [Proteobacteria bacterium]|nr:hypothetical protein [Pseudomonadota bacterium]
MPLSIGTGYQYAANLYSSYEPGVLGTALPQTYLQNLDNINWLLNYYRSGSDPALTPTQVQTSIWELMHQVGTTSTLTQLALLNDGYVPDAGETLAVVVDPVRADGTHDQATIIETKAAKLGDHVWHDRDLDGIQDAGEEGIAGATVELVRDANGDGQITNDEILAKTTTDTNGNYSFKGLTPGLDYQVLFVSPDGYDAASPRQSDGSSASGVNSDGRLSDVIVLKPGEYNATIDSGFYKYAALGDRVWLDNNANGIQDAGEAGRANVQVELYSVKDGQPGALLDTQFTDANGNYHFTHLQPGDYVVKFTAPDGTVLTTSNAGTDDATDSDADTGTGFTGVYHLSSGEDNITVDAGIKPEAPNLVSDNVTLCEDRSAT